jgi:anti-sigma B factor antagonist
MLWLMKINVDGDTVRVCEVDELVAATSGQFRRQVLGAFSDQQRHIEVDLSQTGFVDSSGLGTLIGLYKTAASRKGSLRLRNPQPPVMQILELTRMHRVFQIANSEPVSR